MRAGFLRLLTGACAALSLAGAAGAAAAAERSIWLAGVDPVAGAAQHKGPADYMQLFDPGAPWKSAASKTEIFKISTQIALHGSDAQLNAIIDGLKTRHIKLAVEMGLVSVSGQAGTCGFGVEGYSPPQSPGNAARRIKALGGQIDYIAMDGPVWFGHAAAGLSGGREGCRFSLEEMVDLVSHQIEVMRQYFPDVRVGEIEPISTSAHAISQDPHFVEDVIAFADLLEKKSGRKLAFLHADVGWAWPWKTAMENMARQAHARGIRFGVICDGDANASDDAAWVRQAVGRCLDVISDRATFLDDLIVQSWEPLCRPRCYRKPIQGRLPLRPMPYRSCSEIPTDGIASSNMAARMNVARKG
jgi:hypothetical protein